MPENTVLFTPRQRINGVWHRQRMQISELDEARFDNSEDSDWVELTDLTDGKKYVAQVAACGFGCKCDAIVKKII